MRPGITYFPFSAIWRAPAGMFTRSAGPAATMRPSRTTMVAFGVGARSVPSINVKPVNAVVGPDCAAHGATCASRTSASVRIRFIGLPRRFGIHQWYKVELQRRYSKAQLRRRYNKAVQQGGTTRRHSEAGQQGGT